MRSRLQLGVILALILVTPVCAGVRIQAWNPATHIYIAKSVYPAYAGSFDLWYGAIAPDMAMYVYPDAAKWSSSFWDTHWTAIDLRLWAATSAQRLFAKGWITHNERYAADHFAHGYPPLYLAGYVTLRANILAAFADISTDLAHMAVETAIDIHMRTRHPDLAWQLPAAVPANPSLVQGLLSRVFVGWPLRRTDLTTLAGAEQSFGCVILGCGAVPGYAPALQDSTEASYFPMAEYGAAFARSIDPDSTLEADDVAQLLGVAMALTADYEAAVNATISAVRMSVPR